MAHVRQSRIDYGIAFEVEVLQPLKATSDGTPAYVPESISQKVFTKSFCKSRFPYKSVETFFILVIIKGKLMGM